MLPPDEDILGSLPPTPRTAALRDLARALGVDRTERAAFRLRLHALVEEGRLGRFRGNRYGRIDAEARRTGTLIMTHRGFGFVNLEGEGEDLYIDSRNLGDALHRDRVVVETREGNRGRTEGIIVDVLERGTATFVGTYREAARARIVHPQDTRLPEHVIVEKPGNAQDGDLVAAEFTRYPDHPHGAACRVIRVFSGDDVASQETDLVVHDLGLRLRFPSAAEAEAASLPDRIPRGGDRAPTRSARPPPDHRRSRERPRLRRRGACRAAAVGGWRLTVAIADVSWYVQADGPLDQEASARGFSVYLPDRVIPMLPHRLSSDLCSLRPEEDRLAMVVECTITPEGEIEDAEFAEAIIRSHARFTYDRAARMLGMMGAPPAADDSPDFEALRPVLEALRDATRVRRRRRRKRGYLDMALPEPRVFFATDGGIDDVRASDRHEAHQMIEDAMLVANEATAELFVRRHQASIFRIHGNPPVDGLARLRAQATLLDVSIKGLGRPTADGLSRWLADLAEHPLFGLLGLLVLRSMAKAVYDEEVAPHFGLGAPAYLHFTSPIRRYPDLVVHRLLKGILRREQLPTTRHLGEVADQCSRRERVAVDAERTVLDLYKALYLRQHIGESFEGVIVGVTGMGVFVQLQPHLVEGFVPVDALDDDFYSLDDDGFCLLGRRTGNRYTIGDRLRVRVVSVELRRRRVELDLEERLPRLPVPTKGG
ncbi:MAG: VacB/RNase II family 3'-5' exoribonuclease [bacterium]